MPLRSPRVINHLAEVADPGCLLQQAGVGSTLQGGSVAVMRSWPLLVALAACSGSSPGRERRPPAARAQVPDPVVDADCLTRARAGTLNEGLVTEAAGFMVTAVAHTGAHLHRAGRPLTDAESEQLWSVMSKEVFAAGGLASGSSGRSSIYTCDDVPKLSCFKLSVYTCQVSATELAARLDRAVTAAGVAGAELSVDLGYMERGPRCKQGAACNPAPHYSTKAVAYDPRRAAPRRRLGPWRVRGRWRLRRRGVEPLRRLVPRWRRRDQPVRGPQRPHVLRLRAFALQLVRAGLSAALAAAHVSAAGASPGAAGARRNAPPAARSATAAPPA
jgi:hypothetical protein